VAASSRVKGLFTKETLSPSKNFSETCEGRSGVVGNFASAAQLIPCYRIMSISMILVALCRWALTRMTSRFWGSRNVRPSIRSLLGDMIYEARKEKDIRNAGVKQGGVVPHISTASSWACGVRSHARHVITSGSSQSGGAFPASAATRVFALARHGDAER
jgi:hypothetical protein